MKEEWLMPGAVVPVDAKTTAELVAEIKRLIGVVGDLALRQTLAQPEQKQWQNLTDDEIKEIVGPWGDTPIKGYTRKLFDQIEVKLKEKNGGN